MHRGSTLLVGSTPTDHGLGANQRRSVGDGAGRGQRGRDRLAVVAVDARQNMPAVGLEAQRGIVGKPALHLAVDGNAIVIVNHDQLAELLRRRRMRRRRIWWRTSARCPAPYPDASLSRPTANRVGGEVQHGIQQHGCVAVRQHESVAIPPPGIPRIELKHVSPKDFGDVGQAHWGARMPGIGPLNGVH